MDRPFPPQRTDVSAADWSSRVRDDSHVDINGKVLTRPDTPFGKQVSPFVSPPSFAKSRNVTRLSRVMERELLCNEIRDLEEDKMLSSLHAEISMLRGQLCRVNNAN